MSDPTGEQIPLPPSTAGPARPSIDVRKLGSLVTLLLCGLVTGVIVAAAAFPAVGISALTAKATADAFLDLPSDLKTPLIPQTSVLYDAEGNYITSFFEENRYFAKLPEIPEVMKNATIAAEDQRFRSHRGVDPRGMIRAFFANQSAGEVTQGASTLTQQYIKMTLQYAAKTAEERRAASEDTVARKVKEARYAIAVEEELSKDEILERYLNLAFYGQQSYGITAAAKAYFTKAPKELTIGEAALLAGLVQSPSRYDPLRSDGKEAKKRRNYVLDQMAKLNFVSDEEAEAAKKEDIVLKPSSEPRKCENSPQRQYYGFYCGYFVEWWKDNPAFGKTRQERERNLEKGGYRITSAFNPVVQNAAQTAVDKRISRNNPMGMGIVVIEPGTGRVQAMAINRTYSIAENPGKRPYPNTTNPLLSASTVSAGYQAGSTFKMFTMAAALEKGLPLNTKINAPQQYKSKFLTGRGSAACAIGRNRYVYCPKNASPSMSGTHTMLSGYGESVNTYFIQLEEMVGVPAAIDMAERLGIKFRAQKDLDNKADPGRWGSFTLGTAQVPPLDMANAYATIAARGKHCDPLPILKVTNANGEELPYANPHCEQVIPPDVADAAADAARCPVGQQAHGGSCTHPGGGVTAASVGKTLTRPIAGKTGTTDQNNAAWFIGFTPNIAAAVFKANPDRPNTNVGNTNDPIEVFKDTMRAILPYYPTTDFVPPTEGRINGTTVDVPTVTGSDPKAAEQMLKNAGFSVRISPDKVDSEQPKDRVASTSPAGGEKAPKGSLVTVFVSTGKRPESQPSPGPGP